MEERGRGVRGGPNVFFGDVQARVRQAGGQVTVRKHGVVGEDQEGSVGGAQRRQEFANDPENLLAVDGQANEDKSASSADQWLPPNTAFRCDYVKRQIAVKNAYGLSVTRAEQDALAEQLSTCSG